jgi:hypothetical protein
MEEYLTEINNLNRYKYVEKLIREDLEKRGKKLMKISNKLICIKVMLIVDIMNTTQLKS